MSDLSKIRNFVIIAHIDHGKSTLADRFLEITKTITKEKLKPQHLDQLSLERERGITIKMQPVRMAYALNSEPHILNLIDTPGHYDFSYEVSRALAAVEGAVLLIDATQGVQAQTLSNFYLAKNQGLTIIPVLNKIDLVSKDLIEERILEISQIFKFEPQEILLISAKTGQGVDKLIEKIIQKVPAPKKPETDLLQALIFDSHFDTYKGVILHIRIFSGEIDVQKELGLAFAKVSFKPLEIGIFNPNLEIKNNLSAGEIGYIATGLKNFQGLSIGDTILAKNQIQRKDLFLPGYKEPQSVVFANFFPEVESDFENLKKSLGKLRLNDPSLNFSQVSFDVLGRGFQIGFLGMLHMEITKERLEREFGAKINVLMPSVKYRIILTNGSEVEIHSASQLPDISKIKTILEPFCLVSILVLKDYLNEVMELVKINRGEFKENDYLSGNLFLIKAKMPLADFIKGFSDDLKKATSGYTSLSYEILNYEPGNLVRLDILLNKEVIPGLSMIVSKTQIEKIGRSFVEKLKDLLPKENFSVPIQAAVGSKVIARETLKAMRKDVTGYLYGGDRSRKMKLWKKQQAGKKRLAQFGKVRVPFKVFLELMKIK